MKKAFSFILLLLSLLLASCKINAENGKTPYVENGYWYIDGVNTGVKAEGTDGKDGIDGIDGKTPYIENGYWYIDGVNTGIKAECGCLHDKENEEEKDEESEKNEEQETYGLPSYWKSYLDEKIAEVNSKLTALGNSGDAFIFITDQHLDGSEDHSSAIINYITANTSIKKVVFGGDILQGGASDIDILREYRASFNSDILLMAMRGNHDATGNLTESAYYDIMISPLLENAEISDELYYYYDNTDLKIRYIVTDSVASKTNNLTSEKQISWLKSKILELDSEWTTVIFHHGIWEGSASESNLSFSTDGKLIVDAIDSIYDDAKCTIAGIYSGHTHRDYLGYSEKGYALVSVTVNASSSALTKYDPENSQRPTGTTKEEALEIVFITPSTNTIETIRIGAGSNKTISYSSNVPRDVSGVSLSKTTAVTRVGGTSVTLLATLTPVKVTNDAVIWSILEGAELGELSYDGLACIFTPYNSEGVAIVCVTTVQGGFTATCKITITDTDTSVNITDAFSWTPGSITYADGVASSQYAKDWLYSSMIDVGAYDSITFSHVQTTNTVTPLGYAFYDADGKYISGASNGGMSYDTVTKTVAVPQSAKYFRVMWMNTTHARYDEEKYEISANFFCYGNIGDSEPEITHSATGITLDKTSVSVLQNGDAVSLTASITPQNATNKDVVWFIESGAELGELRADGLNCLFIPGENIGSVVIKVKTSNGEFIASCTVVILERASAIDITSDFTWTPGSITYENGVASSQYNKDWLYSNMVDVGVFSSITFSHVQTTNTATPLGYAFYDESGNYICGASNGGVSYDTVDKTVEIPEGAKYFRVMWMNTTHSRYDAEKYDISKYFYCFGNP